jgi:hypothetical protein
MGIEVVDRLPHDSLFQPLARGTLSDHAFGLRRIRAEIFGENGWNSREIVLAPRF